MIAAYVGIAAIVAVAGAGAYAWDADKAFQREKKRADTAELQRDQFQKAVVQCRTEIAEKNAIVSRFSALPEVRLRLCVQRSPADACCRPAPAPPATDECKP